MADPFLGQVRFRYVWGKEQVGEPIYGPGNRTKKVKIRFLQQFDGNQWADVPEVEPALPKGAG